MEFENDRTTSFCSSPITFQLKAGEVLLSHPYLEYSFACSFCNKEIQIFDDFVKHIIRKHAPRDLIFGSGNSKRFHFNTLEESNTKTNEEIIKNVERQNNKTNLNNTKIKLIEKHLNSKIKKFSCFKCKKKFSVVNDLISHKIVHRHQRKNFRRNLWTKTRLNEIKHQKYKFSGIKSRKNLKLKRNVQSNLKVNPKTMQCNLCLKKFRRADLLKTHKKCHKHEKSHKCNQCEKTFISLMHLIWHNKSHWNLKIENIRQFNSMKFPLNQKDTMGERKHPSETFRDQSNRNININLKPVIPVDGTKLSNISDSSNYLTISHVNEFAPFFTYKKSQYKPKKQRKRKLEKHQASKEMIEDQLINFSQYAKHHENDSFKCLKCEKVFLFKSSYENHLSSADDCGSRKDDGNKGGEFNCLTCFKNFHSIDELQIHCRSHEDRFSDEWSDD